MRHYEYVYCGSNYNIRCIKAVDRIINYVEPEGLCPIRSLTIARMKISANNCEEVLLTSKSVCLNMKLTDSLSCKFTHSRFYENLCMTLFPTPTDVREIPTYLSRPGPLYMRKLNKMPYHKYSPHVRTCAHATEEVPYRVW
jgi:hypothetical protein